MVWTAANIDPESSIIKARHAEDEEYVSLEATLARLTGNYKAAMNCVGALTRASLHDKGNAHVDVLRQVANAARDSFEAIICSDLVAPFAPGIFDLLRPGHNLPPKFNANRATDAVLHSSLISDDSVKDLAYLSLVNYADLLVSCSPQIQSYADLLVDKPYYKVAVKGILQFQDKSCTCWCSGDASSISPRQLALMAYCNAGELDGSDPILWLRTAAASRSLTCAMAEGARRPGDTDNGFCRITSYRRLERYALERGSAAVPENLPPNRTIQWALRDFTAEEERDEFRVVYLEQYKKDRQELSIDMTRYSWNTLGRALMRICRQGMEVDDGDCISSLFGPLRQQKAPSFKFMSPMIILNISPMLSLPLSALGRVIVFLGGVILSGDNTNLDQNVKNLESTCLALSASIIAARAKMEEHNAQLSMAVQSKPEEVTETTDVNQTETSKKCPSEKDEKECPTTEKQAVASNDARSSRTSKRVRSRTISSEKQNEREIKKSSVEHLLTSIIFQCKLDDLTDANASGSIRDTKDDFYVCKSFFESISNGCGDEEDANLGTIHSRSLAPVLGGYSLYDFVKSCSIENSGPHDLLRRFLLHVSKNTDSVFLHESTGVVVLGSCLLECFDALLKRSGVASQSCLCPSWISKNVCSVGNSSSSVDTLALNLLHAELKMKRCERFASSMNKHALEGDDCALRFMIPELLVLSCAIEKEQCPEDIPILLIIRLRCRCHWLAATYYLWLSKTLTIPFQIAEVWEAAMSQIDNVIEQLEGGVVIKTPHLASPSRVGSHWKELSTGNLMAFKNELQATSILSRARRKFEDLQVQIQTAVNSGGDLSVEQQSLLRVIGDDLIRHYENDLTNRAKMEELLSDFTTNNESIIIAQARNERKHADTAGLSYRIPSDVDFDDRWGRLWKSIPTNSSIVFGSKPSLIFMIASRCIKCNDGSKALLLDLIGSLILVAIEQIKFKMKNVKKADKNCSSDSDSFSDRSDGDDDGAIDDHIDHLEIVMCFLLDKMSYLLLHEDPGDDGDDDMECFVKGKAILVFRSSMFLSSFCDHYFVQSKSKIVKRQYWRPSLSLLCAASDLMGALLPHDKTDQLKICHFGVLAGMIVRQRQIMPIILRTGASMRKKDQQDECCKRIQFIAAVAFNFANILSTHLCSWNNGCLKPSVVLSSIERSNDGYVQRLQVTDALTWFWKYVGCTDSLRDSKLHSLVSRHLKIPIAAAIAAFCGAAGHLENVTSSADVDPLDFYDSDCSIVHLDSEENQLNQKKSFSLRLSLSIRVRCIFVVFDCIDEEQACETCVIDNGPLLPLVVVRVLTHLADIMLEKFYEHELSDSLEERFVKKEGIWSDEFPFGLETSGSELDTLLSKAYLFLHGISLSGQHHPCNSLLNSSSVSFFAPETVKNGCQLYRCAMRIYSSEARKSPPKNALEYISSVLPSVEETNATKAVRQFIYANNAVIEDDDITHIPSTFPFWVWSETSEILPGKSVTEVYLVRKGLSRELASGPLPLLGSGKESRDGDRGEGDSTEERDMVVRQEIKLYKKILAVIEDICFSPNNYESWYTAGQCLASKADMICDRLGGVQSSYDPSAMYHVKSAIGQLDMESPLESSKDLSERCDGLGKTLDVYMQYSWANFSSLLEFSNVIQANMSDEEPRFTFQIEALSKINALYENGDFYAWQNTWGSVFVGALRVMVYRCFRVSLHLAKEALVKGDREMINLVTEISETIGTSLYGELQFSTSFGYPMGCMLDKTKYQLAKKSLVCFQYAIDIQATDTGEITSRVVPLWQLYFMKGKCEEKMGSTVWQEKSSEDGETCRSYEKLMGQSLLSYSIALREAIKYEDKDGPQDASEGGSSHGKTEALYRIHASRLKILIRAIRRSKCERQDAEREALRLTANYWFGDDMPESLECKDLRDQVWFVLGNIIAAMVQCRNEMSFFHRSVYRHAQALCWAPLFHDPDDAAGLGSFGTVPAHKSSILRGFNSGMSCIDSALPILNLCFEKKRPQLCGVWVTSSASPAPFETLNDTNRKYNALRCKYTGAYIDCLRLSQKREYLETFMSWTKASRRDLPAFYHISAQARGGQPKDHPNKDSLLRGEGYVWFAKHYTNRAIAEILKVEMDEEMQREPPTETEAEENVKAHKTNIIKELLEKAYECFLRLNCSFDEISTVLMGKSGRCITVVEVEALIFGVKALKSVADSMTLTNGMEVDENTRTEAQAKSAAEEGRGKVELLEKALDTCQDLFNNKGGSHFARQRKKLKMKRKSTSSVAASKPKQDSSSGGKKQKSGQQQEEMMKKTFVVGVPDGLSVGSTFQVNVKVGPTFTKRVKLKVPSNNSKRLRFAVSVPKVAIDAEQSAKTS